MNMTLKRKFDDYAEEVSHTVSGQLNRYRCKLCPDHCSRIYAKSTLYDHVAQHHPLADSATDLGSALVEDIIGDLFADDGISVTIPEISQEAPRNEEDDLSLDALLAFFSQAQENTLLDAEYGPDQQEGIPADLFAGMLQDGACDEADGDGVSKDAADTLDSILSDREIQELLGTCEDNEAELSLSLEDILAGLEELDIGAAEVQEEQPPPSNEHINGGTQQPGRRTLEWWRAQLDKPVWSVGGKDARMTVRQLVYAMLREKRQGKINDNVFDRLCRFMSEAVLPPGNLFPPSRHVMRGLLDCPKPDRFEHHVCLSDHVRFEYAPKDKWELHKDDTCSVCGERRFDAKIGARGNLILTPRKSFWYFSIGEVLQTRFFSNPKWTALRRSEMEGAAEDPCSYFGAEEARRLNQLFDGKLSHPDSGCYELGFDFVQVFNIALHSVGVVCLRSADIPMEHKGDMQFGDILLIIPGPKEPANIDIYLEPLLDDLQQIGPLGTGIRLKEHTEGPNGIQIREFLHTAFLTGWHADRPALGALLKSSAVAAYMSCCWCLFQATRIDNGRYPLGYSYPEPQPLLHAVTEPPTPPPRKFMYDQSLKLTSAQHLFIAQQVKAGVFSAQKAGCSGMSSIFEKLPYLDRCNLFLVPAAHSMLYGLLKGFWNKVLTKPPRKEATPWYVVTDEAKAKLRQRGEEIRVTSDFGRGYKCVVNSRSFYTMDDHLMLAETYSQLLLRHDDIFHPQVAAMWKLLRTAILHYARDHTPAEFTVERRQHAREHLLEYARRLQGPEKVLGENEEGGPKVLRMPASMCTPNLHMLLCRLFDQESAHGSVARNWELWVERWMQWVKRGLKFRICSCPEKLFINDHCIDIALDIAARQKGMLEFDDWCPSYRSEDLRGNKENIDEGDDHGLQLIGVGSVVPPQRREATFDIASSFVRRLRPAGWTEADVDDECGNIRCYSQADIPLVGSVNSTGYARAKSRVSYYVLYNIVEGRGAAERAQLRVAKIKSFLRLTPQDGQEGAAVLRLAVCDVYRPMTALQEGDVYVVKQGTFMHQDYALEIGGITALLVSAQPEQPRAIPGRPVKRYYCPGDLGKIFFTRFGNVSKMKAALA